MKTMDKPFPNRQSIRLKKYDYSQSGFYFVTICTEDKIHRFGDITGGNMQLNEFGKIIIEQWNNLPNRFSNIKLDQFITMPNHIHGIIQIVGAPLAGARNRNNTDARNNMTVHHNRAPARGAPTVGQIIGEYKSLCVHNCLQWIKLNSPTFYMGKLWQSNYWEHIVRNENELNHIRDYIRQNPQRWEMNTLNGIRGDL
ncbi:MAG: transposase [Desulfamplus sp.]|nr:transposase [Desulfamplus sp.]